jgi:hypothetical protein
MMWQPSHQHLTFPRKNQEANMPFSGNTYAVPAVSRNDAVAGEDITSAHYLTLLNDLETAFNTTVSVARGGTGATTAAGALANFGITTLSPPSADRILFWDESAGTTAYLTVGSGLTLSGTSLTADGLADGAYGDITVSGATWTVGNSAITTAKINDSAVTTEKINDGAVTLAKTTGVESAWTESGVTATTSGTEVDIGSIPAGVTDIEMFMDGVSSNGSSIMTLRLGDSGGFEETGYSGGASQFAGSGATAGNSTGFRLQQSTSPSDTFTGKIGLKKLTGNTWIFDANLHSGAAAYWGAGSKTLSAELTQIRLTAENGTDTFDAGQVRVRYR